MPIKQETYRNLTITALDRLRAQYFGDKTLRLFRIIPETGETEIAELADGWVGRRVNSTTESGTAEAGAWQFQIKAMDDWQTSQIYISQLVSLRVGDRRWKVKKVEMPVGEIKMWRVKAEIQ